MIKLGFKDFLLLGYIPIIVLLFISYNSRNTSNIPATAASTAVATPDTKDIAPVDAALLQKQPEETETSAPENDIDSAQADNPPMTLFDNVISEVEQLAEEHEESSIGAEVDFVMQAAEWDIPSEEFSKLGEMVETIEFTRLQAQALLDELEFLKQNFDGMIKGALDEETYASYRATENKKQLSRYFDDLESHFKKSNQPLSLSNQHKTEIARLLSQINGGVTVDQSKGPYGTPPAPSLSTVIPDTVSEAHYAENQLSLLAGEKEYLLSNIQDFTLRDAIEAYYDSEIDSFSLERPSISQ